MANLTPHLEANVGDIAKTVLMPGDPLRAEYIAKTYLTDVKKYNNVRGMYGFTGMYKDTEISIQGSGMGCPSMGIYSYELYTVFGVENIMRIGSAGSINKKLCLRDIVIGLGSSTDSNYQAQYKLPGIYSVTADFELVRKAVETCEKLNQKYEVGNIVCSDAFYSDDKTSIDAWQKMGCLAIEMESTALYLNAARLGKRALCIATISDEIFSGEKLTADERQTSFNDMMKVALETAVTL